MSRTRTAVLLLAACLTMSATAHAEEWTETEKAHIKAYFYSMEKTIEAWTDEAERQIGRRCMYIADDAYVTFKSFNWYSIARCIHDELKAYRQVKNGFPALKGK